ncbi:anaerobic C4-dicarboxylate transporter family protein [Shigella flexneri]
MSACVCVLGVAWLGDTLVKAHISDPDRCRRDPAHNYPWLPRWCCSLPRRCCTPEAATSQSANAPRH